MSICCCARSVGCSVDALSSWQVEPTVQPAPPVSFYQTRQDREKKFLKLRTDLSILSIASNRLASSASSTNPNFQPRPRFESPFEALSKIPSSGVDRRIIPFHAVVSLLLSPNPDTPYFDADNVEMTHAWYDARTNTQILGGKRSAAMRYDPRMKCSRRSTELEQLLAVDGA